MRGADGHVLTISCFSTRLLAGYDPLKWIEVRSCPTIV
ncbi:hypothetical protein BIWAKO_03840 [Bosea sp. BIWAKO-01]|nr:hypothetical protein BIWAKO_03840 [Bosea sp. BIWAKO-01]